MHTTCADILSFIQCSLGYTRGLVTKLDFEANSIS